jgi:hypothetical protein
MCHFCDDYYDNEDSEEDMNKIQNYKFQNNLFRKQQICCDIITVVRFILQLCYMITIQQFDSLGRVQQVHELQICSLLQVLQSCSLRQQAQCPFLLLQ